jgi:hypothetical protein
MAPVSAQPLLPIGIRVASDHEIKVGSNSGAAAGKGRRALSENTLLIISLPTVQEFGYHLVCSPRCKARLSFRGT